MIDLVKCRESIKTSAKLASDAVKVADTVEDLFLEFSPQKAEERELSRLMFKIKKFPSRIKFIREEINEVIEKLEHDISLKRLRLNSEFLKAFRNLRLEVVPLTSSLSWIEDSEDFFDNFATPWFVYNLLELRKDLRRIVYYLRLFNIFRKNLDSLTSVYTAHYARSLMSNQKILSRKVDILETLLETKEFRRK